MDMLGHIRGPDGLFLLPPYFANGAKDGAASGRMEFLLENVTKICYLLPVYGVQDVHTVGDCCCEKVFIFYV